MRIAGNPDPRTDEAIPRRAAEIASRSSPPGLPQARPGARNDAYLCYVSFTFFSGRVRTGLPVAAWIALSTAGVVTQMVGSPTPPQKS